jgi:hypothetical protein
VLCDRCKPRLAPLLFYSATRYTSGPRTFLFAALCHLSKCHAFLIASPPRRPVGLPSFGALLRTVLALSQRSFLSPVPLPDFRPTIASRMAGRKCKCRICAVAGCNDLVHFADACAIARKEAPMMLEAQAGSGSRNQNSRESLDRVPRSRARVAKRSISNRYARRLEFNLSPLPSMQIGILIGLKQQFSRRFSAGFPATSATIRVLRRHSTRRARRAARRHALGEHI